MKAPTVSSIGKLQMFTKLGKVKTNKDTHNKVSMQLKYKVFLSQPNKS